MGFWRLKSDHLYSGLLGVKIKPWLFVNTDKIPAKLEAFKVTSKKPRHRGDREENDEVRFARCFQKTFCDVHLQCPIGSTDGTYTHLHGTTKINQIYLVSDLFGMVKWPFEGVKWPPTRGWKGHFESPGRYIFTGMSVLPRGFTSASSKCSGASPTNAPPGWPRERRRTWSDSPADCSKKRLGGFGDKPFPKTHDPRNG